MATWVLVPCLISLRAEFNTVFPFRLKDSDGAKGDDDHAERPSDHNPDESGKPTKTDADKLNEVHAIDVDTDLKRPGWSMQKCVDIIVARHKTGRDDRLQNIIYNRRIWSESTNWEPRPYNGTNAHTQHAHFGAKYVTALEASTKPWGLLAALKEEVVEDVALTTDLIPVSRTTGRELFEPDLAEGTKRSAAELLQLAAIWAKRGADGSIRNAAEIDNINARLNDIEAAQQRILAILTEGTAPATRPETQGG
jgi:hypothetical protein